MIPSNRSTHDRRSLGITATLALMAALAVSSLLPAPARADITYSVVVDTSALPNATNGILDFQFNPGGVGADAATATIANYTPTAIALGAATDNGGGTGALPGTLTITNSSQLNEVYQVATFGSGSGFTFTLTLSGPAVNNPTNGNTVGTSFTLGILDSNFNPFAQFGNADPVLQIDLNGGNGTPVISTIVTPPIVSVTPVTSVPEPTQFALITTALVAAGAVRGWHRARYRVNR